jgi:hypothetical protein
MAEMTFREAAAAAILEKAADAGFSVFELSMCFLVCVSNFIEVGPHLPFP